MKITSDLHVHSFLSSCAKTDAVPADYLELCKTNGITTIGFADHMWDNKVAGASPWYKPQDMQHISQIREMIPSDIGGIRVLFGCETEYIGGGVIGITKESARELDFVLIPPNHFHMKDFVIPASVTENDEYKKYLIDRFMEVCDIELDVPIGIAHPFMPLGIPDTNAVLELITDDEYIKCFTYAKHRDKSIEIQTSIAVLNNPEYNRMIKIASDCGCMCHIGSDSHGLEKFNEAHQRLGNFLDELGVNPQIHEFK